jgi:hypothetical protein
VAAKFTLLSLPILQTHLDAVGGRLLLTVHDSIVGEYPSDTPEAAIRKMVDLSLTTKAKAKAEETFGINLAALPLAADLKLGLTRWG